MTPGHNPRRRSKIQPRTSCDTTLSLHAKLIQNTHPRCKPIEVTKHITTSPPSQKTDHPSKTGATARWAPLFITRPVQMYVDARFLYLRITRLDVTIVYTYPARRDSTRPPITPFSIRRTEKTPETRYTVKTSVSLPLTRRKVVNPP